ncbi:DJ-1 family glyoxalase III [Olsenella sp. YH-ols2223]|uniref:DJ-1 family glyoxalase III n=1 Tax=Olsenella absiana TaxID=3115222 RepID=A0ABU7R733_9ACTN
MSFDKRCDRRVAAFLADGCEEVEALAVVDVLFRMGIPCDLVAVSEDRTITSSHRVAITCDKVVGEVDFADYDLLFLPGGMPGTNNLAACGPLVAAVDAFVAEGRDVAAICAAPAVVLARRGLLRGRRATSNPNFQHEIAENGGVVVADERVVVDGSVLTSQGMGTATDLGLAIVRRYLGEDAVAEAKQKIVYWG